ncbi:MAG: peptide-methionine (R)-S-oxide reductase MsrB [Armatimonadota bacterium]|nr:peptide-methionine (R)-S-oxide reductase MsrB [Armatimonadota bacterium]
MKEKVIKSDEEWREQLTEDEYKIMRQKGTEPAFKGKYWKEKHKGVYKCAACGQPLFRSQTKYESGTGWPSFYEPIDPDSVETAPDTSHGMSRTEILCSRCEAHLGHVFDDGPNPTGLRYCTNSASLKLEEESAMSDE